MRHWGSKALLKCYEPVLANPSGGGPVPRRWGCSMARMMVWAPEVPPGPHPLVGMDSSLTFATPVNTRYPLMLQLGGLPPQFTLTHRHTHAHTRTHKASKVTYIIWVHSLSTRSSVFSLDSNFLVKGGYFTKLLYTDNLKHTLTQYSTSCCMNYLTNKK